MSVAIQHSGRFFKLSKTWIIVVLGKSVILFGCATICLRMHIFDVLC
jgi:hypothetical protein